MTFLNTGCHENNKDRLTVFKTACIFIFSDKLALNQILLGSSFSGVVNNENNLSVINDYDMWFRLECLC
jgi:hypothetical protein